MEIHLELVRLLNQVIIEQTFLILFYYLSIVIIRSLSYCQVGKKKYKKNTVLMNIVLSVEGLYQKVSNIVVKDVGILQNLMRKKRKKNPKFRCIF